MIMSQGPGPGTDCPRTCLKTCVVCCWLGGIDGAEKSSRLQMGTGRRQDTTFPAASVLPEVSPGSARPYGTLGRLQPAQCSIGSMEASGGGDTAGAGGGRGAGGAGGEGVWGYGRTPNTAVPDPGPSTFKCL